MYFVRTVILICCNIYQVQRNKERNLENSNGVEPVALTYENLYDITYVAR